MILQGAKLFDKLIVAIGVNPAKKPMFTLDERINMLCEIVYSQYLKNVEVQSFENEFLVDYARQIEANYLLRGIRSDADYAYEHNMRNVNSDIIADWQTGTVNTVFLIPPREVCEISSSLVKGLIGPKNWEGIVSNYVPRGVFETIIRNREEQCCL